MAEMLVQSESLTSIADKIRVLSGTDGAMSLGDMETHVGEANTDVSTEADLISQIANALEGKAAGGAAEPVLQTKTVTPTTSAQNVTPDSGYDGLSKVTVNAMPTATQATPSISVNSSGLITASATQTAGYVSAGTKSGTKQLTTQAAKTITPSTSSKTAVAKNVYTTGAVTVAGDANLVADNIKSGISIFGVAGSYEGNGGGSGGVSADTCTVTIEQIDSLSGNIIATQVENGVETIYNLGNYYGYETCSLESLTIDNVKCGSVMVIEIYDDFILPEDHLVEIDNGATVVDFYRSSGINIDSKFTTTLVLKVPTTANVNCVAVIT